MVSDVLVGSQVAGYRIERELARGAAGVVYLAYDPRLGRKVALKLLPRSLAEDEAFRERFVRSSLLTAAIEHPNVIPVYEAGESEGVVYLVMRYIPGGSLRVRLDQGRLEPGEALAILRQVALALDAAHAQRFVHRDVKPQNILVDATGTAYLVDFFVAALSADEVATRSVFGTPAYMAPEVCRGEDVDERADLYSLACVLFECLTGAPPFGPDHGMATVEAHVREPPPKLSERCSDLPRALDAVFDKALAKSPGERFDSAEALLDAVTEALGRRGRPIESGIVTFVFTDIEGSTRILRELRGRYPELVAEHQRLLRSAFAEHGGTEVDTQGESSFVVFPTASGAVLAAIEAQRALESHEWPAGGRVRVRIGVHTGHASRAGERYFGLAVHRAARICAFGSGGQTVISETTRALLDDEEEELPGIAMEELGPHELKDFERPVRLYGVAAR
jgi:serine/threonine protein kinase